MNIDYVNYDILRKLFNKSLYLDVVELKTRKSERLAGKEKKLHEERYEEKLSPLAKKKSTEEISTEQILIKLSPQAQEILSHLSPDSQYRLAREFDFENRKNAALINEVDDPDYIQFNPSANGLYLEFWVCANIPCPICGGKLYKYANPNMPAVDVLCIHHTLKDGVKYFQIKATLSNTTDIYGLKYFSYKDNYVCTGSKRFGYNCHIIKAIDNANKDLLVGYICIEYKMVDYNNIKIDIKKSFLLLPNINFTPNIQQNDLTFYSYTDNPHKAIITFNKEMVNKISFSDFYKDKPIINNIISNSISLDIDYDATKPRNELSHPPMMRNLGIELDAALPAAAVFAFASEAAAAAAAQQKYFIMKMKYLNLKKKLNNL
jgi:hypothetical protein